MSFFSAIKNLLPISKAFDIIHEKNLRSFFKGLSVMPDDVKKNNELVYSMIWPETTDALEEWELQFGVNFSDEKYLNVRSGVLKSLWQMSIGGQSLSYMAQLLKNLNSNINVYENIPVRNPVDSNSIYACMCGQQSSVCGNKKLSCGYMVGDSEFVPFVIKNDKESVYDIPFDASYWENYFFVCKNAVKNSRGQIIYCEKIILDVILKPFVEYIILKVKPVHMGGVLFVEYSDNLTLRNRRK